MRESRNSVRLSRNGSCVCGALVVVTFALIKVNFSVTQSIGYHPQFNFGFNPYHSPVFGYGLGLPFGAYNISPTRYPWLVNSIPSSPFSDKTGLMSKVHAKAFLKKLATSQIVSPGYYGVKDKLNLMKHPEYAYTPFGAAYGYGKHYGAAVMPNNPYKSVYSDYYDHGLASSVGGKPTSLAAINTSKHGTIPIGGRLPDSPGGLVTTQIKPYFGAYLRPILKAGALLTTAAILGKKVFEVPIRLNPTGMILNDIKP